MADLFSGFDAPAKLRNNVLYYGDNLTIMELMPTESVDLIYLDPPFNSQRSYNLIYRQMTGLPLPEQEDAFSDAWEMDPEKEQMITEMPIIFKKEDISDDVLALWNGWIKALRHAQPALLAYLVFMTFRIVHMRRLLKKTGSLYLHCDPTASHYIKVMLDAIFGHRNFRNEIIWQRTGAHNDAKRFGRITDTILYYSKTAKFTFNPQYTEYDPAYIADRYHYVDDKSGRRFWPNTMTAAGPGPDRMFRGQVMSPPSGTHWRFSQEQIDKLEAAGGIYYSDTGKPYVKSFLDERKGRPVQNLWTDIAMSKSGADRLGYATQKPIALLERIIRSSTNEGDVVFDPFCGCGTSIYAAQNTRRKWIGCDIAILSVHIVRDFLKERYGLKPGEHYEIEGVPVSVESARHLMEHREKQFQHWAVETAGGFCSNRHSGDLGIDGRIYTDVGGSLKSMIISVKGGKHVNPSFVRELRGTVEREDGSWMGGLILMEPPTKGMLEEAAKAGMVEHMGTKYPKLQIRTIEQLLDDRLFDTPSVVKKLDRFRQAAIPFVFAEPSASSQAKGRKRRGASST